MVKECRHDDDDFMFENRCNVTVRVVRFLCCERCCERAGNFGYLHQRSSVLMIELQSGWSTLSATAVVELYIGHLLLFVVYVGNRWWIIIWANVAVEVGHVGSSVLTSDNLWRYCLAKLYVPAQFQICVALSVWNHHLQIVANECWWRFFFWLCFCLAARRFENH